VQRSSATLGVARTATMPAVGTTPGNVFGQGKSLPLIAMAHEIPYVATAIVSELRDLEAKVTRAYIPAEASSGCYRPFRAVGFGIASLILNPRLRFSRLQIVEHGIQVKIELRRVLFSEFVDFIDNWVALHGRLPNNSSGVQMTGGMMPRTRNHSSTLGLVIALAM